MTKYTKIKMLGMAAMRWLGATLVVIALSPVGAMAQLPTPAEGTRPYVEPPPAGSRDFHGNWYISYNPRPQTDDVPYQPWAHEINEHAHEMQTALQEWHDNSALCHPMGALDMFWPPYGIRVYENSEKVYILSEMNHERRVIYMNEEHPDDLEPSFWGHSVGHWEGNTLVVDTIGFNDRTNLLTYPEFDRPGGGRRDIRHTEALHLVERWSVVEKEQGGRALRNDVTITDPGAFTAPWNATFHFDWRPDLRLVDEECNENNFVTLEQIEAIEARGEEIPAIGWVSRDAEQ